MYVGAFLLRKREENDDIINSASDVEGKKCPQVIGKRAEEAGESENV